MEQNSISKNYQKIISDVVLVNGSVEFEVLKTSLSLNYLPALKALLIKNFSVESLK